MEVVNSYTGKVSSAYNNVSNTINDIKDTKKNESNINKVNNDSIQISEKDENIINTKKALDSLNETNSQYENPEEQFPPAYYVIMFKSMMEDQGITVPDFKLDGENPENTNFIDFVDKLKDFAKSLYDTDAQFSNLPSSFFEFCDKYKENLIKNGCK